MTTDEWVSGALTRDHDVSKFDCGVSSLNDWLRQQAMRAQEAGTARLRVDCPRHPGGEGVLLNRADPGCSHRGFWRHGRWL